jgi:hypothetical protein
LNQAGRLVGWQGFEVWLEGRSRRGNVSICTGCRIKIEININVKKGEDEMGCKEKKRKELIERKVKQLKEGKKRHGTHILKDHTREGDSDVEDISPKPSRGSERRDEGFDKQPQTLGVVATFSR